MREKKCVKIVLWNHILNYLKEYKNLNHVLSVAQLVVHFMLPFALVIVISGEYANGKEPAIGKVTAVSPKEGKVMVEGVQMVTKHVKPRRQGETGGIVKRETPIRSCKVALFCDKCGKGVRVGFKVDGDKKTRVCRKCGAEI